MEWAREVITELRIQNLGVIAAASVQPGPGFTALTGETGAGKTMVLTALEMLLGGKVDSAIADGATIDGLFAVPPGHPGLNLIEQAGGVCDDAEIVLGRTATNGRLRAFAGGRMVPAALLTEVGEVLVTVHGQASQQRLRGPAAQRRALDRFGDADHEALLHAHRQAYARWQAATRDLEQARQSLQETQQRILFLRTALEDIEKVDPQPGEADAARSEQHRLTNLADISAATGSTLAALLGDDEASGAADLLHAAARMLGSVDDPQLQPLHERLISAAEEVSDIGRDLSAYTDGLADEPGRLDWLNARLHELAVLDSRYGPDVLAWSQAAAAELTALERGVDIEALEAAGSAATLALEEATVALTASRRSLAARLAELATAELRDLAMPNASLQVSVTDGDHGPDGADEVAFLLAPHPGSTPAPIAKAASGGELSRIMLALEVVLADTDTVGTFVFDEVDAGVGGAAATAIGRRLARLAEHAQVIVVTHMPQVAAFAGTHLRVLKQQDADVTVSDVRVLDDEERVVEIARMLAGQEESASAREHARELLTLGR
jgi:DNA repair protein RecN (Recombination protein N)